MFLLPAVLMEQKLYRAVVHTDHAHGAATMRAKWQLRVHERNALTSPPISSCEFGDLPSLRATLVQHRERSLVIVPPSHATQNDFLSLIDLRCQGFDINRQNDLSSDDRDLIKTSSIATR